MKCLYYFHHQILPSLDQYRRTQIRVYTLISSRVISLDLFSWKSRLNGSSLVHLHGMAALALIAKWWLVPACEIKNLPFLTCVHSKPFIIDISHVKVTCSIEYITNRFLRMMVFFQKTSTREVTVMISA